MADNLDPPELAGHGMPFLESKIPRLAIDGIRTLKSVRAVNAGDTDAILGPDEFGRGGHVAQVLL